MNAFDYEYLCRMLKERSGFVLAPEKQYLVDNRLTPVARRHGCATVSELIQRMRGPASERLRIEIIEAMMNNESFFFRDKVPFDLVREVVVPELLQKRAQTRRIRVWCAACSTGQEPYSLAMLIHEIARPSGWQFDIVASDIAGDALERAKASVYTQFEVQRGLPIQLLVKYFEQISDQWRLVEKIRNMVQFRQINLLSDFSMLGTFDLVLLRNVLIYFDHATKLDVLSRIRAVTATDGYLVLGAAETMVGLGEGFAPIPEKRSLYRPKPKIEPVLRPVAASGARVA
jgi:chemotaxis protein methyltransferase CheR